MLLSRAISDLVSTRWRGADALGGCSRSVQLGKDAPLGLVLATADYRRPGTARGFTGGGHTRANTPTRLKLVLRGISITASRLSDRSITG